MGIAEGKPMRSTFFMLFTLSLAFPPATVFGQPQGSRAGTAPGILLAQTSAHAQGTQKGLEYSRYKEGYRLILDAKWEQALARFNELISKYPHSTYVEDARYWSAYALMHSDRMKALAAYQKFIRNYPNSGYIDDAIADFTRLRVESVPSPPGPEVAPPRPAAKGKEIVIDLKALERDLKQIEFRLQRQASQMAAGHFTSSPPPPVRPKRVGALIQAEKLHALAVREGDSLRTMVTQLQKEAKIQAFKAIVTDNKLAPQVRVHVLQELAEEAKTDDRPTFQILKELALDKRQPIEIRAVAMSSLLKFTTFDPLPVLEQVLKQDPDEEAQHIALGAIVESEKGRSLNTLIDLFDEVPRHRTEQQEMLLQIIAEENGEKGTDFLVKVARGNASPELKTAAVMYLSETGRDKNRSVGGLISLFESIGQERKDELHTILYGIANVGNNRAVEFLGKIAQSNEDEDLQGDAIYYLSNIGGRQARVQLQKALNRK